MSVGWNPREEHDNSSWVQIRPSCCEVTKCKPKPTRRLYLSHNVMKLLWSTKVVPSVTANKNIRVHGERWAVWTLSVRAEALYCASFGVRAYASVSACVCSCVHATCTNACRTTLAGTVGISMHEPSYICLRRAFVSANVGLMPPNV